MDLIVLKVVTLKKFALTKIFKEKKIKLHVTKKKKKLT